MSELWQTEEHQWLCLRIFQRPSTEYFLGHGLISIINLNFRLFLMGNCCTYKHMLVSHSRFKHILQPIADVCIRNEQREFVDFDSFFTHTICHECCHGIGPHSITLPNGKKSTVRKVRTIFIFCFDIFYYYTFSFFLIWILLPLY